MIEKNKVALPLVLIVDDEKSNRYLLEKALHSLPCKVISASNGEDAVEYSLKNQFALILLDMVMPGLNGHEVLEKIKKIPHNKEAPVFMVTAIDTDTKILEDSYRLGAVDFIKKPISVEVLRKKASYFIEMFRNKQLLEKEKNISERLVKSKMNLMASITHELRSPLFAMIGMTDVLETMGLNEEQEKVLHKIQSNSEYLMSVVNSFLDYSKLEEGKEAVKLEEFGLFSEITELVDIMSYQNQRKESVVLKIDIDSAIPSTIVLDKTKLRHILINLISNSLKFTLQGEVKVQVRLKKNKKIEFKVSDTGIGIKDKDLDQLFERYVQVENEASHGGTGLGLSISNIMVEIMGGKLDAKSTFGEGSCFFFEIPYFANDQVKQDIKIAPTKLLPKQISIKERLKVLIVDDVIDNLFIIENYLRDLNLDIRTTQDPEEALEILKTSKYDICFMDINMPIMNGTEVLEHYLASCIEKKTTQTPVIALTAHVIDEKLSLEYQNMGFTASLSKPIRRKELVGEILNLNKKRILKGSPAKPKMESLEEFDLETLFGDLDENIKSYLPKYLSNKVIEMDEMVMAFEKNDMEQIKALIHKILGTALSFGIVRLNDDLALVQKYIHANEYTSKLNEIETIIKDCSLYIKKIESQYLKN